LKILNVVQYVTFRTAAATLTALLISLLFGPWLIRRLQEFQIGQHIREEGPKSHHAKAGTPTMGGVLIVASIILPTLMWANLRNPFVWLIVLSTLAYGAIGFADDYLKIRKKRNLGLTARQKMTFQFLVAILIGVILLYMAERKLYSTAMNVPFFKGLRPDLVIDSIMASPFFFLGFLPFLIFVAFLIVGSSNAVNLTDGLDGLAIGCTLIASTGVDGTDVRFRSRHAFRVPRPSEHLGVSEVTIFCGSMVGASLGFLWYNAHPAEVFMGDVGSLALGGALGAVAVVIKQELLLPFRRWRVCD
jgi:phospho-N-acetylmuramoyl-pentapeptide-transferase